MLTNFKTMNYKGCINLKTNDLYLSKVSPKYRRVLNWSTLKYSVDNKHIDQEVHEAIRGLRNV